ncbi:hypothetical protein CDAR_524641, partial [Caerostris darwini]
MFYFKEFGNLSSSSTCRRIVFPGFKNEQLDSETGLKREWDAIVRNSLHSQAIC